jgi:hypothetical protein
MYLAKLEIMKGKSNKSEDVETEKAFITVFDNDRGDPFLKHSLENFEKRFDIITTFDHHGDVYLVVKER